MRAADLDLRELLETAPGGIIRFAGQRALILDATAMGLLRKELIETVGAAATRGILTRLGFAHGWRTAEALEELPWDSEDDFRTAGARIHTLQGQVLPGGGRTARNLSRRSGRIPTRRSSISCTWVEPTSRSAGRCADMPAVI